jgi:hypothetical protein
LDPSGLKDGGQVACVVELAANVAESLICGEPRQEPAEHDLADVMEREGGAHGDSPRRLKLSCTRPRGASWLNGATGPFAALNIRRRYAAATNHQKFSHVMEA